MGYRYKSSIPVSRERQRKIWEASRAYDRLALPERARIDELCRRAGGNNERALAEFVTTSAGATAICLRHYIASKTTLYRAVRRYYILADREKLWKVRAPL